MKKLEYDPFLGEENKKMITKNLEIKAATTLKENCDRIMKETNDTPKISEEEKAERLRKIMAKLRSGKKLSEKELSFLKCTDRNLYACALRAQKMAETVENELKHAKSKEEANRIISQATSGVSDKDPDREFLTAAINRVTTEFRKSKQYQALPATTKEAGKRSKPNDKALFKAEDDEKDFDLSSWSPINDVLAKLPVYEAKV